MVESCGMMNRNKKIIVGVVGISIILLGLLGVTYAYYLTRIQGNTNTNSVSITTADLKLEYDDGTTEILIKDTMLPDETVGTKDLTVTNKGNVVIEDYAVYLEEVTNSLSQKEDMILTMTCVSSDGTYCEGYNGDYPSNNTMLALNSIGVGVTHSYEIDVFYNDTGEDQSIDMGSTLTGKVQIYNQIDVVDIEGSVTGANEGDYVQINSIPKTSQIVNGKYKITAVEPGEHTLKVVNKSSGTEVVKGSTSLTIKKGETPSVDGSVITINNNSQKVKVDITSISSPLELTMGTSVSQFNPYEEGTLAYNIYDNSKLNKNGTSLVSVTPTKIAAEASLPDEKVLSKTGDDYGTTYFYRGSVEDNYVNFAGMCWRIVRIEGDGSVKLLLEDRYAECNDNETEVNEAVYTGNWVLGEFGYGIGENFVANYEGLDTTYGVNNGLLFSMTYFIKGGTITSTDPDGNTTEFKYDGLTSTEKSYLKTSKVCLGSPKFYDEDYNVLTKEQMKYNVENLIGVYYDSFFRLTGVNNEIYEPTLHCTDDGWSQKEYNVFTLTADEAVYAGGAFYTDNKSYYLINDFIINKEANGYYWFWTMTPSGFIDAEYEVDVDSAYAIDYDGWLNYMYTSVSSIIDDEDNNNILTSRPAISLKNGIKVSDGDGTKINPYIISGI